MEEAEVYLLPHSAQYDHHSAYRWLIHQQLLACGRGLLPCRPVTEQDH